MIIDVQKESFRKTNQRNPHDTSGLINLSVTNFNFVRVLKNAVKLVIAIKLVTVYGNGYMGINTFTTLQEILWK